MQDVVQLLVGGIAQGCVYGLIALGFVLIYKATEQVNFAQGDLMMLGAFVAVTLIAMLGLPYWLGLVLAMAAMAAFGYALDKVVFRPLLGQPQFAIVILTISLGFVIRAGSGFAWGTDPITFGAPYAGQKIHVGGAVLGLESVAAIVGTLLLSGVLYAFFRFTKLGVAMQASSQNQLAAYYVGIPVKTVFSLIWALSAAVAAAAGILLAPIVNVVELDMGFVGIKAFAAAVVGGFGSLPGALLGGLLIGVVEPFAAFYSDGLGLPKGVPPISAYIVMLLVLIIRPQGLFAQIQRKKV